MKPVKSDVSFPQMEESVLRFWNERGIVEKGLKANEGKDPFIFYDGPPFATGLPHYGHILAGTLKDVVPRYWVMKGYSCRRRWGWDTHGLPIEFEIEKDLGLSGLQDIQKYGIANFNEKCRSTVLRYTQEWERVISRTGRWADFKNAYRTMDMSFMESVWWVFNELWKKGLVYEGYRVMPYSWRITTPLSNFEAGLNYQSVQDPALTVKFRDAETPTRYFLAWTTTPWTLPSNLALAVGPDIVYNEIREQGGSETFILAAESSIHLFGDKTEIVRTWKGSELEGKKYQPLFPYFADRAKQGAFRIVTGAYVATGEGTGIVHTAPAFGEDDFAVCQKNNIPLVDPVDSEGNFTSLVPDYAGKNVKEADKEIIKDLKAKGVIARHDVIVHNYPYCYRSDTPLIYKAISTWFVKLDPIKEKLIANNAKTHWVPEHLRDGRFGNWLENARDWNVSRNRFWGTPIPLWRGEDGELLSIGSVEELEKLSGKKLAKPDIHKHFIDDIELKSPKSGKMLKRIPEVFDCWFESGSMPYAQEHYPFENRKEFEANFPARFIAEGLDQTRGWFYTLSVLSTALFDKPPFQNVIVNGLVLASDGKKMSKRLKNYPDPSEVLDKYGADAMRVALMNSPAAHADDMRFTEEGVKEVVRSVLLPLWNAYSFFVTYALADEWKPKAFVPSENDLDRWVISRLQSLIRHVDEKMANYHLYEVVPGVLNFIDELTNWYIRLNRRRFWSEEQSADKEAAYGTLYFVLTNFSRVLAPFMPFVTDEIYQNLEAGAGKPESIHLASFPEVHEKWIDLALENEMDLVRRVVSMGRNCRNSTKLKTRQPLRELKVITLNAANRDVIVKYAGLLRDELNVKDVTFSDDEAKWVSFTVKPNWKELGKKYGAKSKERAALISSLGYAQLQKDVPADEYVASRSPKQEGAMLSEGEVTVWLDTKLDEKLVGEGLAREFVSRVQKLRKDIGLDVTDRISLTYQAPEALVKVLEANQSYITEETLATTFLKGAGPWTSEQDIEGHATRIGVAKA